MDTIKSAVLEDEEYEVPPTTALGAGDSQMSVAEDGGGAKGDMEEVPTTEILTLDKSNQPIGKSRLSISDLPAPEQMLISARFARDAVLLDATIAYRQARANKGQCALGILSVLFVVTVTALIITISSYVPAIFLSLAKSNSGEIDMRVTSSDWLNYSLVASEMSQLANNGVNLGAATPRYESLQVDVYPMDSCTGAPANATDYAYAYVGPDDDASLPSSTRQQYSHLREICDINYSLCASYMCNVTGSPSLFLIDSLRELDMDIGSDWPLPVPLPSTSVALPTNVADALGVSIGGAVIIQVFFSETFSPVFNAVFNSSSSNVSVPASDVYVTATLAGVFDMQSGKFDSTWQNIVVMEFGTFVSVLAEQMNPAVPENYTTELSNINLYNYAQTIILSPPPPRSASYVNSNMQQVAVNMVAWSSNVNVLLGFYNTTTFLPLLVDLMSYETLAAILNLLMNVIIVVLGLLSIFLIYNQLLASITMVIITATLRSLTGTTRL